MTVSLSSKILAAALCLLWTWSGVTAEGAEPARKLITTTKGDLGRLLRQWDARRTAAGNTGDFYDNRDRGHSGLSVKRHPQLQKVVYTPAQLSRRADWGGQRIVLPHVTFGNSSTASHATTGGCHSRRYYHNAHGLQFLFSQYARNNLYVYPEHTDHDPGHNGLYGRHGDLFPTNTPYVLTSQGSSGSDQPFVSAIAHTLAAFRPAVKRRLIEAGLLMPTVQMILRSSAKNLTGPKDYLTGKAHPTAFVGKNVNALAMVKMAHSIQLGNLPPAVALKVVKEDEAVFGRDVFDPGKPETLGDTPCVIARIVRGRSYLRKITVSAEASADPNKRPLTFHWVVLRGDATRIKIKRLNTAGSVAELTIPYHHRRPVLPGSAMESNRVDIGVFVHNGAYFSAPAFVTFFSLDNEARTYDKDGRLLEIAYQAGAARLSVQDWRAAIQVLGARSASWADRILKKSLTPNERGAITGVARAYARALAAAADRTPRYRALVAAHKQATAATKKAQKARTTAAAAHKGAPTAQTAQALAQADQALKAAKKKGRQARARHYKAGAPIRKARRAADAILDKKAAGLGVSPRKLIAAAFERIARDPLFVARNHKEIDAAFQAAPKANQKAVTKTRKRIAELGVISDAGGFAFELQPERKGPEPAIKRLSRFERSMLDRLNKMVIANLLHPKLVKAAYRANYVHPPLAAAKAWRDVYTYKQGELVGWTRIETGKRTDFNADGLLVLERDPLGRCIKARTVKYQFVAGQKPRAARRLQHVPGDEIVHHEYAGKDDWKGRVTKREPAPKQ